MICQVTWENGERETRGEGVGGIYSSIGVNYELAKNKVILKHSNKPSCNIIRLNFT